MMRNDYRRSLILLRSNAGGYSGHVRLERRTLTAGMTFLVRPPNARVRLEAALAGCSRSGYFACPLGQLRRDDRGQAVLNATFDPRNLCGRELEDYALIVVSEVSEAQCSIVLFGNVNGHTEIDGQRARAAVCALYRTDDALMPEGPESEATERSPETTVEEPAAEMHELPLKADEEPETAADPPEVILSEPASEESDLGQEETELRAGDLLALDMDIPWPDAVETLRPIFRENPPAQPAPDDVYVYVSAPMPAESGYDAILAGIRTENGAPASVRYALPALWSAAPPAGLENYTWSGDSNKGWWVAEVDLRTQ